MRLFIDTNVALDYLLLRSVNSEDTEKLFVLIFMNEFEGWISSSSITDMMYILSNGGKKSSIENTKDMLLSFISRVIVFSFSSKEALLALKSDWNDIEDACIYECARTIDADCIITNNTEDFKKSKIPVLNPKEFFEWLKDEHNINYSYLDEYC